MFATSLLTIAACLFTDYEPGTKVYMCNRADTGVNAITNFLWLNEYTDLVQAGDKAGLQQMARKHQIVAIPNGQEALVIRSHRAVFSSAPGALFYEVRVKDAKCYVAAHDVLSEFELQELRARQQAEKEEREALRAAQDPVVQAAAKTATDKLRANLAAMKKERTDAAHAAGLLAVARNLEKIQKPDAALKSYRELLAKYPNSAEAKAAGERIKALGAGGMP